MASRRQQAAPSRQPAAPRAQGVDRLPDDLLVRILGGLSLRERQCAALVSRRWHSCAHAPELCREVEMKTSVTYDWNVPVAGKQDLPSFGAWLRRHGRHVRRLVMHVFAYDTPHLISQQLAQCMSAAADTMPQLEALFVGWTNSTFDVSWAGHLPPSLRKLGLHQGTFNCRIRLCSSLSGLTQLTKLMFSTAWAAVDPEVQLPPSVRTLAFDGYNDLGLPPQLSTLARVDTLVFGQDVTNFDGLEACVAQMARLTFLELEGVLYFPPCISSLTSLQHLAVAVCNDAPDGEDLDGMAPALQPLTGLTALLLAVGYPLEGSPPPALAGLSRLQRLCFLAHEGPLPLGPYSASLRVLGASAECLNRSTVLLASCGSLEHAAVLGGDCDQPGPLWQWAAQHPPLRRLQAARTHPYQSPFKATDAEPSEPHAVTWLRQARPQLEVDCTPAEPFLALFKWQDPVWQHLDRF